MKSSARRTVQFRSPKFFSALVASVRNYVGRGSDLVVTLSDDDDTELSALLRRFEVKRVD